MPIQTAGFRKKPLMAERPSPSSPIIDIGTCTRGKVSRSCWIHCLRTSTMSAVIAAYAASSMGSQASSGASHAIQGRGVPEGSPS